MGLNEKEKGILLLAARESILSLYDQIPMPKIDYSLYPNLASPKGAFVTLIKNNELRGCIGFIQTDKTLFDTVCEAAKLSAVNDPRFPPVTYDEVSKLLIEISVLSEPKPITNYNQIILGEHGLIVEEDGRRGLLLPQVATENNFTLEEFLTAICRKAGLYPYLWREKILNLFVFTADVFKEEEHKNLEAKK